MQKITLILSLFLILHSNLFGQNIEWQNTIGGNIADNLTIIQQTNDGGYICGGYSNSDLTGDKTEACLGINDYWIIKLDASGNIQWQNTIGGSLSDVLISMIQTNDGGYLCGGYSQSNISGDKTDDCKGSNDYWIVKLDASGNIQWQKTIGGSLSDALSSVIQTTDGGYLLGGSSASNISGDKTEDCIGLTDFWIVKTDPSGNIQWQNTIGGNQSDLLQSIRETSDGGFICGGRSISGISGDKTEANWGSYDYWVVKLDVNGIISWQNTIGGSNEDDLYIIEQTLDGGYICGGHSQSNISGDKTENRINGFDYWIIKLDDIGNMEWQNTIGGNGNDYCNWIQQTEDANYIVGGYSFSTVSGDKTEPLYGATVYWIMKLDQSGRIMWQNSIGGNGDDQLSVIIQTNDGGYVCGGKSTSGISIDKTEACQGNYDYWIVKLDGKYNLITGKMFVDANSNSIFDAGDEPLEHKAVHEPTTGDIAFANSAGEYIMIVKDSGNYIISPDTFSFFNEIPINHSAYFNNILQTDPLNDFAYQPAGNFDNLTVSITSSSLFRTARESYYYINYSNEGNSILSPDIVFYPDDQATFLSSSMTPSLISPDSIVFSPGILTPFQHGQFRILVILDSFLPPGTPINSSVSILPISSDALPNNNSDEWNEVTIAAYDPNDILVNRSTINDIELIAPPFVEYTIRFQNTGNDTAFYVRVDDKITNKLQLNSFEFIGSSHQCDISYQSYDSTLKFTFNNILLPDSNMNEPESHGFVRYRIKPQSSLLVGDSIQNNALIFFDYNPPVSTNTAVTEIVTPSGINTTTASSNINIYPNPVTDKITIEIINSALSNPSLEIYNIFGQIICEFQNGNVYESVWLKTFDVSDLAGGMYFIKVKGLPNYTSRFIKY